MSFQNYTDSSNWHPAANLFPLLPAEDLHALADDIKVNGLLNPVVLHDNKVLDGRNRLLACLEAEVEPTFTEWGSGGLSPIEWVISQNLHRRHLTAGQRAAVAVESKPLLAAEAKKNQKLGGNPQTFLRNEKPLVEPINAEKDVAKRCDVSQGYVYAVQKIKDKDDSIFQQVKAGTLSIPEAQVKLGIKQTTKALGMSESNEWYTPEEYIEAARTVMGGIDLDPASNDLANSKVVKAPLYYTEEDDGLSKPWKGRVWLNPPYADIGPKFVAKLIEEYEAGNVSEAILLVNPRTETIWFQKLFKYTLCFTNHRLKFWKPDGFGESPTTGSVFVYLGPSSDRFTDFFGRYGTIVERRAVGIVGAA